MLSNEVKANIIRLAMALEYENYSDNKLQVLIDGLKTQPPQAVECILEFLRVTCPLTCRLYLILMEKYYEKTKGEHYAKF